MHLSTFGQAHIFITQPSAAIQWKDTCTNRKIALVAKSLIICLFTLLVDGFGAPGIIPPESFIAERWYPSNLPTVMPPWKMPGVDIENFRTARPHNPPGSVTSTTTLPSPTGSLPMPPGTSPDKPESTGPHPPGTPPSPPTEVENTTESSGSMTLTVTMTNSEPPTLINDSDFGSLTILSPDFEDITKVDNSTQPDDLMDLQMNLHESLNSHIEGSAEEEINQEVTSMTTATSETTTVTTTTTEETTTTESTTTSTTTTTTTEPTTTTTTTEPTTTTTTTEPTTTTTTTEPTTTTTTESSTTELTTTTTEPTTTVVIKPAQLLHSAELLEATSIETTKIAEKECKDILFLLDSSGNVEQQYEKQKRYIERIVDQLEDNNKRRLALITFSGRSRQRIVVPLSNEPNAPKFIAKLKRARFLRGITATGSAISATTQYILQKGRNVQVVVVTDGFSFDDVQQQAEALRSIDGVEVYVTGQYFPIVKNVLVSIAGSDRRIFFNSRESKLIDALKC
ncbi:unnamed protein product [Caenorhabditis bovis]|uniref:VWFA domain-containing protein n=1 Tax=Caenorhabditis bovis TaxID=2654633 RepID=A0A8S1FC42_9PELO|nr:unnamed protein product [Caenorhabditis bovis]